MLLCAVKQFCQAIDETILSEKVIDFQPVIDLTAGTILDCKSGCQRKKDSNSSNNYLPVLNIDRGARIWIDNETDAV